MVLGLLFATGIAAFAFACGSDPSPECVEQACPDSGSETSTSSDGGLDSTSIPDATDATPDALDASDASDSAGECPGPSGTLDPTFGDGGMVWLKYSSNAQAFAVAVQSDGNVVVAGGTAPKKFALVRLLANGTPDPAFGKAGLVENTILSIDTQPLRAVVIQPDGKIVAAGPAIGPGPTSYDFVVLRFNPNGTLDTTFGNAGAAVTDFGNTDDYPRSVILQPDGRILVAGQSETNAMAATSNFTVARYNTDGSLDATFGTAGKVTIDMQGTPEVGGYLALVSGGKIIVAGATGTVAGGIPYEMSAVRLNSDGSLDTTFANAGKVVTGFGAGDKRANSIVVDSTGSLVLGGFSSNAGTGQDFGVLRLDGGGTADRSFGDGGVVSTDFTARSDAIASVLLQEDGRLLVAGVSLIGSGTSNIASARYLPNGQLDTSFGAGGKSLTPPPASSDLDVERAALSGCTFVTVGTWGYDNNTIPKNAIGVARFRR